MHESYLGLGQGHVMCAGLWNQISQICGSINHYGKRKVIGGTIRKIEEKRTSCGELDGPYSGNIMMNSRYVGVNSPVLVMKVV